jgi:hypothetical protein
MLIIRLPNGTSVKLRHQPRWLSKLVPELMVIPYGQTIYVTKDKDLTSLSLNKLYHEQTHLEQQDRLGSAFIWTLRYFLSKKFRLDQEAEAYANQIKHTVTLASRVLLLKAASKWLAGSAYKKCASSARVAEEAIYKKCSYKDFL